VHTNGIENFWSLLKCGLKSTYISVEPFHLFRYLDEQAFRLKERKSNDGERFVEMMSNVAARRVTYRKLTGKDEAAPVLKDTTAKEGNASESGVCGFLLQLSICAPARLFSFHFLFGYRDETAHKIPEAFKGRDLRV